MFACMTLFYKVSCWPLILLYQFNFKPALKQKAPGVLLEKFTSQLPSSNYSAHVRVYRYITLAIITYSRELANEIQMPITTLLNRT
jgi:hypothetical protein